MADYKISLGAELRTKEIDKQVDGYKGNIKVGVDPNSLKNSIDTALNGYTPQKEVEVKSTLNTQGITDSITKYSSKENRKKIKVGIDTEHLFDGVEGIIGGKTFKTPLKVNVDLNWAGVASQIANPDFGKGGKPTFHVDVDFDDNIIETKWNSFAQGESRKRKLTVPIQPTLTGADAAQFFSDVETTLGSYEAKTPLKVHLKLNKTEINQDIATYNQKLAQEGGKKIIFNATLRANAIDDAISNYLTKYPDKLKIPIDFKINSEFEKNTEFEASLKQKIQQYENTPVQLPVVLKPASKGFKDQISKVYATVEATLTNPKAISEELNSHIQNPIPVSAKLVPAAKGFTSEITKTPIKVQAELAPDALNNAIANPPKTLSKLPIGVTLTPANKDDINNQIGQLKPFIDKALEVGVALDEKSANDAITTFVPTAKLKVEPDLVLENIDGQIEKYVPSAPVKVNLQIDNNDIDEKTGKQNAKEPILVNVQLDREKLNEQIRSFKTGTKIKVGVKLDFASHKDEAGKEIQKGISKQIKEYQGKTKLKVGVEIDPNSVSQAVQSVGAQTPIQLGVELDPNGIQNVENQINGLRQQIQNLGNVRINLGGGNGAGGAGISGVGGQDVQAVRIVRGIDDVTRAYRELLSIQSRMGSKQQAVAKLDTTKNQQEILELSNQIDVLARKYQRIHQLFSGQFSDAQVDALNRNFEKTAEKLSVIRQKALDAKASLDKMDTVDGVGDNSKRQVDEATQAYRDLMAVLNELNSKRLQLNGLDASSPESSNKIQKLRLQIEQLDNEYNNLLHSFSVQGIQFTADQWNQLETVIARVGRQIDVVQAGMSDKSAIQSQTQAYKELMSISKEIGSLEINIAKLKNQGGNTNQIETLENQLRTLQNTYRRLVVDMDTPLTADQWSSIYTQIAKTSEMLAKLQAEFTDTREEAAKAIKIKFNDGDFNVLPKINSEVKKLSGTYPELAGGVKQVEVALHDMETAIGTGDEVADVEKLIAAYERLEHAVRNVNNQLDVAKRSEKDSAVNQRLTDDRAAFQSKVNAWLTKNSAAAKKFSSELLELKAQAENCDRTTLNHLENELKRIDKEAEAAGLKMQTWPDRIKTQFQKYSSYFSVASVFMYGEQALRNMFEQVKLIDSAMTELKKVTNETDESYNRFLTNAASRAKELGTTIDGLVASTADFARLGYGFEDSQKLAEVANIYAVVGDEIEGVEGATQSLVSTLAAFKHEMNGMSDADFAMSIVDKMNEVANNYSISSGGLGEALQRSASSMAAANNTLDETIAMITAANEVAQNPEKVGNAMKTKFLYNCLNVQKCA